LQDSAVFLLVAVESVPSRDASNTYNRDRRAFPHGEAANRVRWGTKQP
jgi:hypothetical protein